MEKDDTFLDLLKKCEVKDREAWNIFIDKYGSYIYHYINKTLDRYCPFSQNGEAGEVFNSVFSTLLSNDCKELKDFQGNNEYTFLGYLREICFRVTLDFLGVRKNVAGPKNMQNRFQKWDRFKMLSEEDLREMLSVMSDELPPRHRYLFRLIYKEGLGSSDIAGIMNIDLNDLGRLKFSMLKNLIKIAKRKGLYREVKMFLVNPPITMPFPLAGMA